MSSKKERKKEKLLEKSLSLTEIKLHYEEFQIPPYCQDHLRALFLEYASRGLFTFPSHH